MRKLYVISGGYLISAFNKYLSSKSRSKKVFKEGYKKLPSQSPEVLKGITKMKCYLRDNPEEAGFIKDFLNQEDGRVEIDEKELFASEQIASLVTKDV
jgi:hypothetical protein